MFFVSANKTIRKLEVGIVFPINNTGKLEIVCHFPGCVCEVGKIGKRGKRGLYGHSVNRWGMCGGGNSVLS